MRHGRDRRVGVPVIMEPNLKGRSRTRERSFFCQWRRSEVDRLPIAAVGNAITHNTHANADPPIRVSIVFIVPAPLV